MDFNSNTTPDLFNNNTPFEVHEPVAMSYDGGKCFGVVTNINDEMIEVDYTGKYSHKPAISWFHKSFWSKSNLTINKA